MDDAENKNHWVRLEKDKLIRITKRMWPTYLRDLGLIRRLKLRVKLKKLIYRRG